MARHCDRGRSATARRFRAKRSLTNNAEHRTIAIAVSICACSAAVDVRDFLVTRGTANYPSWVEIGQAQGGVTALFVGRWGSAEPAADVHSSNGRLTFSTEGFFRHAPKMVLECEINSGKMKGTVTRENEKFALSGKRVPRLAAPANPQWADRIVLFNGKDLSGWTFDQPDLPGITGGAIDSDEDQPGPIYLQGDHGGVSSRNITIVPAK